MTHPGTILFVDTVKGTEVRRALEEVPRGLMFVSGTPVTRILIVGGSQMRELVCFGADGTFLQRTRLSAA